jgi:hypothetical protein
VTFTRRQVGGPRARGCALGGPGATTPRHLRQPRQALAVTRGCLNGARLEQRKFRDGLHTRSIVPQSIFALVTDINTSGLGTCQGWKSWPSWTLSSREGPYNDEYKHRCRRPCAVRARASTTSLSSG